MSTFDEWVSGGYSSKESPIPLASWIGRNIPFWARHPVKDMVARRSNKIWARRPDGAPVMLGVKPEPARKEPLSDEAVEALNRKAIRKGYPPVVVGPPKVRPERHPG